MEELDLNKALDELIKPTDLPKESAVENAAEGPPVSLESILSRLPPEGQAWFNGLNAFCRWAVEYDLRDPGPSAALRFCVPNYGDKFIGGMDCCLNATPRKEIKIAVDAHLKALVRRGDMHA